MRYSKEELDTLRATAILSAVVGQRVKLRRAGGELVGLCPFHEENTPSLRVNDDKGLYHCFGCGAGGDVIRFVMDSEGLPFPKAVRSLIAGSDRQMAPARDTVAVARRVSVQRQAAIEDARAEWNSGRSVKGTPAELYLRSRGITGDLPWSVRFARVPLWRNRKSGTAGGWSPALLLAAQDCAGAIVGVQRVFLTPEGRKLPIRNPKLSLGSIRGTAVRLAPPARHIILVEGPEDGLTLRLQKRLTPIWITLGTGMMPFVAFPPIVEHITLAGDNNDAGRAAVAKAGEHFTSMGLTVDTMFPPAHFEDWNDMLLGKVMAGLLPV